jgi:fucose permease
VSDRNRILVVLTFGFVVFGMALTAIGVAWPSVADQFDRSLAELGLVTLLFGGGYTVSTLSSGRVAARAGIGRLLMAASVSVAMSLLAMAASPGWPIFLVVAGLLGASGGFNDAATNTYVAIRRGPRAMGFIHTGFGVGAVAGPLFVTVLLAADISWRTAFASLAVLQGVYIAGLWLYVRRLDVREDESRDEARAISLRSATLLWSLIVFFLYAGIAAGAGAWAFTFLTEERGMGEAAGGIIVAAYWGGFTASRLLLGFVGHRVRPHSVLRWSAAATLAGLAVFWWNPTTEVGVTALILTGFAHGPVFPLEVLLTPKRFGAALTGTVVGFEFAAGNVGGALLPGMMGLFVDLSGLDIIPPILFANAILLWAAVEILEIKSVRANRSGQRVS